jgi:hypothetical protein
MEMKSCFLQRRFYASSCSSKNMFKSNCGLVELNELIDAPKRFVAYLKTGRACHGERRKIGRSMDIAEPERLAFAGTS